MVVTDFSFLDDYLWVDIAVKEISQNSDLQTLENYDIKQDEESPIMGFVSGSLSGLRDKWIHTVCIFFMVWWLLGYSSTVSTFYPSANLPGFRETGCSSLNLGSNPWYVWWIQVTKFVLGLWLLTLPPSIPVEICLESRIFFLRLLCYKPDFSLGHSPETYC